ncbi:MAG: hypothetical protein GWN93_27040 [Deltaproteobacteria bacterium]|nr:hypothetical protein [Deltaproteobacteria bacterium]
MSVVKITDHEAQALGRLITQFKESTKLKGVISSFVSGQQDLEDVFCDVDVSRQLDVATGQQLDNIGEIVGRARGGLSDEKYRLQLYGQIGINVSKGTPEDLISIFNILTGFSQSQYSQSPIAQCSIFGGEPPISGDELFNDGDMEASDVSAWTAENSATLTKQTASPYEGSRNLRVAYNGSADPGASQSVLTPGSWYLLSAWVRMENTSGPVPEIKNGASTIYVGIPYADWYQVYFTFVASDPKIVLGSDHSSAGYVEYDVASIQLLQLDNTSDIYKICQSIVPGGVRLNAIGWYDGDDAFAFAGSSIGKGFGSVSDPTVGGKYATITDSA